MYRKKTRQIRRRNRRIFIFVICLIAVLCVVIGAVVLHGMRSDGTDTGYTYTASEEENNTAVTYNGKTYVPNDHLSNYLFIGVDSSGELGTEEAKRPGQGGQADAIFLVSYDRKEKTANVFAIPRDTMTDIESFSVDGESLGLAKNHLSLQYAFGDGKQKSCELMETAVSRLFLNEPINGYTAFNLDSISRLMDLVGYVDVVVPDDSLEGVNPEFKKGETVRLTSDNAEQFVRSRDTDKSQSALVRMNRQKVFIRALVDRIKELQNADASTVTDIYEGLSDYMITNMSNDIYLNLAGATENGEIETIPGNGAQGDVYDEYEVDQDGLYDMIIKNFYVEADNNS